MLKNRASVDKSALNYVLKCLINSLFSFALFLSLSCAVAFLSYENRDILTKSVYLVYAVLVLTGVFTGFLSSRLGIKAIVSSAVTALFLSIFILILFAVLSRLSLTYHTVISILIILITTVVSGIVFKNIRS